MTRWTLSLWTALGLSAVGASAAEAGWLTARGDAQRTGVADASSTIATPGIRWRYYVGGALDQRTVRAAAGTSVVGSDDLIYLSASSRVEARRADDVLVWQSDLVAADTILGVSDLDGNGTRELVAASRFSGRAFIYDATSGELLWTSPAGRYTQIGVAYLRDVDGDGLDDLYLSDWGSFSHAGSRWADVWTFAGSCAAPGHPIAIDMNTRDYDRAETEAWADVDGDGRAELVALGARTAYVYSSQNGALIASGDVGPVPYAQAQTVVANLDDDAGDEIVLFTNHGYTAGMTRRHVTVIDVEGANVVVRWEHGTADLTADRHAYTGESVADVDGDGRLDVVSSFYSGATGAWTTYARHGLDGGVFATFPGEMVGAVNLDGDAGAEVVTRPGPGLLGNRVWDVTTTSATQKWSNGLTQIVQENNPSTETRQSLAHRTVTVDVDNDGVAELVTASKQSNGTWFVQAFAVAGSGNAVRTYPLSPDVTLLTAQRRVLENGTRLLVARSDGYLAVLDRNLVPLNEWHYPGGVVPGMRIGGFLTGWRGIGNAVLSADLYGDGSDDLVVRDSRGAVVALDAHGATVSNPPDVQWAVFGQRWTPALADVTGDGLVEVLTGNVGAISARSAVDGAALWTASVTGDTGHLTGRDIDGDGRAEVGYLSYDGPSNDQVLGLRSSTGAASWPEVRYASSGRGSFSFADLDADGVDDVVAQFGAYLRTVDGASGATMQQAYTGILSMAPVVADVDDDGDHEILSSGFVDNYVTYDVDATGAWTLRGQVTNQPATEKGAYHYGALVSCPAGPRFVFAAQNSAHLRVVDPAAVTTTLDAYLAGGNAYASAAAVPVAGGPAYLGNINALAAADGSPLALVNSTDGFLYAIRPCATSSASLLAWRVYLGTVVGEAIPADVDNDGTAEIVVSAADGYLYAIDNAAMASPTLVGEVMTAGGLLTAEVDELEATDGITVEWSPVAGAVGYEVAVFDGIGAPLTTPTFVPVGAATSARLDGLAIAADLPYFTVVRAVAADGSRSFERISDGFRIHGTTSGGERDDVVVADVGDDDPVVDDGGCQTSGGGAGVLGGLAGLVALVLVRRRR